MNNSLIEAVDVVKVLGSGAGQVQALKGVTMSLRHSEALKAAQKGRF